MSMVEYQDTDTIVVGVQKFYPMMLPMEGVPKAERISRFKRALRYSGKDLENGTMHYCEKGCKYGIVFLPDEAQTEYERLRDTVDRMDYRINTLRQQLDDEQWRNEQLQQLVRAYEQLLICYRTDRQPGNKLLDLIAEKKRTLQKDRL